MIFDLIFKLYQHCTAHVMYYNHSQNDIISVLKTFGLNCSVSPSHATFKSFLNTLRNCLWWLLWSTLLYWIIKSTLGHLETVLCTHCYKSIDNSETQSMLHNLSLTLYSNCHNILHWFLHKIFIDNQVFAVWLVRRSPGGGYSTTKHNLMTMTKHVKMMLCWFWIHQI